MIKETIMCPACGSEDVMRHEKESKGLLTLGPEFYLKKYIIIAIYAMKTGIILLKLTTTFSLHKKMRKQFT